MQSLRVVRQWQCLGAELERFFEAWGEGAALLFSLVEYPWPSESAAQFWPFSSILEAQPWLAWLDLRFSQRVEILSAT